jgi:methylenetetrahydrofolate--tRNA-(uracil-5-)-methyltransferase
MHKVLVIGAGLAGSEASYFLAQRGIKVILCETKTKKLNPAQKIPLFAELVCTNSLKSMEPETPHGLLKTEMTALGSLVLKAGYASKVPAGDALAVDREQFSGFITNTLSTHPNITIIHEEVVDPVQMMKKCEAQFVIVATGPLTTDGLADWIKKEIALDDFYFYDAIAPVVDADTLDYSKLYFKDRHKPADESADYLNAPFDDKEYYRKFITELQNAEKVPSKDFEDYKFFEACLPIDLMAERGIDVARYSCMKPIGLEKNTEERRPYAVVQLRKENLLGSAYNMVGFQTRLTYKEQVRVFRMIPGFENASFLHLGSVHRNSYLNSRKVLNFDMSSLKYSNVFFAGQITGVEGYTESATMGLYVAVQIWRQCNKLQSIKFPVETCIGALVNYIMTNEKPTPSNINFGLLPTIEITKEERKSGDKKKIRRSKVSSVAREVFQTFKHELQCL